MSECRSEHVERKRTLAFGAALLPLPPAAVEAVVRAVLAGPLRSLTHARVVLCVLET